MCARCKELEATIERLEAELSDRRVNEEPRILAKRLGLTPTQGHIVWALYRARVPLTSVEVDAECPLSAYANRQDPEYRSLDSMRAIVWQLRRRRPDLLARNGPRRPYELSIEGRKMVKAALDA